MTKIDLDPVSVALGLGIGMLVSVYLIPKAKAVRVNPGIQKDSSKVATMCQVKDIEDMVKDSGVKAYCRCWRSKNFPYCDGSHTSYNKDFDDNVGPLVIKK